jgi:DNA-binding CsgD family transcriptional regulator
MHVPDLYLIAGLEVLADLAPLDATAGPQAARLVWEAGQLPERHQGELLAFARSLPQQDRAEPFPPPREYEQYPPGFGGLLARMLAARNLDWLSSVRVLYAVSLGRVYWSAATVGLVGRGRKEVTPALVTVFAAALGIPAADLAAIGGIRLPTKAQIPLNPSADAMADLTWEARRLTAEQAAARTATANGAPDSAVAYLRRALSEPPSVRLRPDVLLELGFAESYAGDPQAAAHLQAALDIAPATTAQVSITLALGRMLQIAGRNRESLEVFDRTRARLGATDRSAALTLEGAALGAAQFDAETAADAAPRIARLRRLAEQEPDVPPSVFGTLAVAAANVNEPADIVAHLALGAQAEARSLAAEEVTLAQAFKGPRTLGVALRAAGLADGGRRGIELLRQAVLVLEGSGARLEHARAMTDLGAALRRAGQRADSREVLQVALDLAHRCGAIALTERTRTELIAAGGRPRRLVLSGLDSLTPSERRVAQFAVGGMSNRAIAQNLFITTRTVEGHLTHAYEKLQIASREQLPAALMLPSGTATAPPQQPAERSSSPTHPRGAS